MADKRLRSTVSYIADCEAFCSGRQEPVLIGRRIFKESERGSFQSPKITGRVSDVATVSFYPLPSTERAAKVVPAHSFSSSQRHKTMIARPMSLACKMS